jgi:hypothetical protein
MVYIVFTSGPQGIGNVVLKADHCLRDAGLKAAGFVCSDCDEQQMALADATHKSAFSALRASGFEFREI